MDEMQITTSRDSDTITYTAIIDGTEAGELMIWADRREIANVEVRSEFRRQGIASHLWVAANADGQCFHALDHHRTEEGEAFAHAVGGETIDDEAGYVDVCCICIGEE